MSYAQREALRVALIEGTLELTDPQATSLARVWELWAREEQVEPDGEWRTWYVSGGRGSGKTRTGSETLGNWIRDSLGRGDTPAGGDWAIVAPTFGDARDTCVEGPSGLLRALGGENGPHVRTWNRSLGEVFLANGARVYLDGADDGADRVQGKNLQGAWCDEVGLWRVGHWEHAWKESLRLAVRLGRARLVCTGTPKQGHPLVKLLITSARGRHVRMPLSHNLVNLAPEVVAEFYEDYAGSRLGRQELEGEYLEDAPGALWTSELIDRHRVEPPAPQLDRVVVGVDPSGAADSESGAAEIGIVAAGYSAHLAHAYVLADVSLRDSPERWAARAVATYHDLMADAVVAERNFGGDMVRATIHAIDATVNVKLVTASRGKAVRAEPVAVKYDQGRVHHVGRLDLLEAQMTTWNPNDPGMDSPDRVDALVWALTDLMVGAQAGSTIPDPSLRELPRTIRIGDMTVGEEWIDQPPLRRSA